MEYYENQAAYRDAVLNSLQSLTAPSVPFPSDNADAPLALLARCPKSAETPLIQSDALAANAEVGAVFVKDERMRMGLGSFKALGAAYVIACDAQNGEAAGATYVTASAGNHGLSVAAGANAFGAQAVIYLSETVPEAFAARLRALGAQVRRAGQTYEDSMETAAADAQSNGWILLSDSSWPGYMQRPYTLMEGYLVLMHEVAAEMNAAPTHIFLQAGVGGLATACAAFARKVWGHAPKIIVVEPEVAPALFESIRAGSAQITKGPVSEMGRLDCKEPSLIALKGLARDADVFVTITEEEGRSGATACAQAGLESTASGAAGVAGLLALRGQVGLGPDARVLVILSEEATD